jgi:ppGpp synthetase/RelA/SpoT-type nucleotidyltranferase
LKSRQNNSIEDPAIVFCLILDRHRPRRTFQADQRELAVQICERVDRICKKNNLEEDPTAVSGIAPYLDLITIDKQGSEPTLHVERQCTWQIDPRIAVLLSILTFQDVLAVQVVLQIEGHCDDVETVFERLNATLKSALPGDFAIFEEPGVFGASVWEIGLVRDDALPQEHSATRLGKLRAQNQKAALQHFRFLISEQNRDAYEVEFIPHKDLQGELVVPPLLWLETSRLKIGRLKADYSDLKTELQNYHLRITTTTQWFLYFQQRNYQEISELGSDEWEELRGKSQSLVQQLAILEDVQMQIDDAKVTARIAKENYLKIQDHWRLAPGSLTDSLSADVDVFMEQVTSDLRYLHNLAQRIRSILNSVQFQLQLADPSITRGFAVGKVLLPQFALMSALLAIALRVGFPFNSLWLLAILTTSAWVVGALIGSSRTLARWQRFLGSASIASATTAILIPTSTWTPVAWIIVLGVAYAIDSWRVVRSHVKGEFRREKKERQKRITEDELINVLTEHYQELQQLYDTPISKYQVARKLRYARDELYDLFAELPPTNIYRPKDFDSFLEKIGRRHYITVAQVTDAIGIRYVVSPWKIRQYRNRVSDRMRSRVVEEEYHSYFSSGYRAIHLLIDLWGVYVTADGRRFPYMTAEIQIKTPLCNLWSNLGHDFVYKSVRPPNRAVKYVLLYFVLPLLRGLTRLELELFWNWMGWKKEYEIKELGCILEEKPHKGGGREVLVAKVAQGGKADQNHIRPGMRLARADGGPIKKLNQIVKAVEALQGEGKPIFIVSTGENAAIVPIDGETNKGLR